MKNKLIQHLLKFFIPRTMKIFEKTLEENKKLSNQVRLKQVYIQKLTARIKRLERELEKYDR